MVIYLCIFIHSPFLRLIMIIEALYIKIENNLKIKNLILKRFESLLKDHTKITQCSSIVIFLEELVKQLWITDV